MKIPLLAAAVVVLVGTAACAPATPTIEPAQIQASAVAAASTMVAMTQAAAPPPTDIPPTPLPSPTALPSPTLMALPTLSLGFPTSAPLGAPTSSTAACSAPMSSKPAGPLASVRISNNTSGTVVLSLYLTKTKFGECGYRSFNLLAHGSVTATDLPQGCYSAGAFVNAKSPTKAFGSGCISGDRGTVTIQSETIAIH